MSAGAVIVGTSVPARLSGHVAATFERALHARGDDGRLVMVLAESLGPAPHGVVVPGSLPEVEAGARARIADGRLFLEIADGTDRRWTLDGAARYDGSLRPSPAEKPGSPAEVAAAAEAVRAALGQASPAASGAIPGLAAQSRSLVAEHVDALAAAVHRDDADAAKRAVGSLVGLGPGLTPSGDDALVGFLAACWALRGDGGVIACEAPPLLSRTTDVSASYLALACEGRFAEPIASLARAVARGDRRAAAAGARGCLAVGATSGADALGGFLGGYASVSGPASQVGA